MISKSEKKTKKLLRKEESEWHKILLCIRPKPANNFVPRKDRGFNSLSRGRLSIRADTNLNCLSSIHHSTMSVGNVPIAAGNETVVRFPHTLRAPAGLQS